MLPSLLMLLVGLGLPLAVTALGGRGSKAALNLAAGRTSDQSPLHGIDAVTLWCAPDNPQVAIKSATFVRLSDSAQLPTQLTSNKKNATSRIESPTVRDAGEYMCRLDTPHGEIRHRLFVYARPVALTTKEALSPKNHNEYHLEAQGLTVDKGGEVNLTCPVFAYPVPMVRWSKDGNPLALSKTLELEGTTIRISGASYEDSGLYSCEAINEYSANGKTSKLLLVIDKTLTVKSEYAWMVPLAVIVVTLVLLLLTIFFCEIRKRKQAKSSQYVAQE